MQICWLPIQHTPPPPSVVWHQFNINLSVEWHQFNINLSVVWHQFNINVSVEWHQFNINLSVVWLFGQAEHQDLGPIISCSDVMPEEQITALVLQYTGVNLGDENQIRDIVCDLFGKQYLQ